MSDPLLPGAPVDEADHSDVVRCTGCRRPLHNPVSRARGHGPVCTDVRLREPRRGEQQETLPGL